jgi:hypothetical protein
MSPGVHNPPIEEARAAAGIDIDAVSAQARLDYNREGGLPADSTRYQAEFDQYMALGLSAFDYMSGLSTDLPGNWPANTRKPVDEHEDRGYYLHDENHPIGLNGFSAEFSAIATAYRPLMETTVIPKLWKTLTTAEPLLAIADTIAESRSQEPDNRAVAYLKTALKRFVQIKWGESPDSDSISPAYKEYARGAAHIEEDPPLKSGEPIDSEELQRQLNAKARIYRKRFEEESDSLAGLLSRVCSQVANGDEKKVPQALMTLFNPNYDDGADILDMLDIYAATLSDADKELLRQELVEAARGHNTPTGGSRAPKDANAPSSARELLTDLSLPKKQSKGIEVVPKPQHKNLFTHDGGTMLARRLLMPSIKGYTFGEPVEEVEGEDPGSILLRDPGLSKTDFVPGFTSDTKLSEGLFISAADRDPYDVSGITVSPERVMLLTQLLREGGLTALSDQLDLLTTASGARLDMIIEAFQAVTIYDEVRAWETGTIDLTRLQDYGAVKNNRIVGNCSVSASILREAIHLLGLQGAKVVGGIPLDEKYGVYPAHAQVIFKDASDKAYVIDATGNARNESDGHNNVRRFTAKLALLGSHVVDVAPAPATLEQWPDQSEAEKLITETKDEVLEAALLLSPSAPLNDHKTMQFDAIANLSDDHVLVKLYQGLLDLPNLSPVDTFMKLNAYIAQYETWIKVSSEPYPSTSDPIERFRYEAEERRAVDALYGSNISNLYAVKSIVASLRSKLLAAVSPS